MPKKGANGKRGRGKRRSVGTRGPRDREACWTGNDGGDSACEFAIECFRCNSKALGELRTKLGTKIDQLTHFQRLVLGAEVGNNLPLRRAVDFLKCGQYLNVFEVIRKEHSAHLALNGAKDSDIRNVVVGLAKDKLGKYYDARICVERALRFGLDAHYGAINFGGIGSTRYGPICLILKRRIKLNRTCFDGDSAESIRMDDIILDADGVLRPRFAHWKDRDQLASVRRFAHRSGQHGIDRDSLVDSFESSDHPLEVHLHGRVTTKLIKEIRVDRRVLNIVSTGPTGEKWSTFQREQIEVYTKLWSTLKRQARTLGIPVLPSRGAHN